MAGCSEAFEFPPMIFQPLSTISVLSRSYFQGNGIMRPNDEGDDDGEGTGKLYTM